MGDTKQAAKIPTDDTEQAATIPVDSREKAARIPMDGTEQAAVIIGLGFLVLVGVIFVVTLERMNNVDNFLMVWTAVGPIVGVVIGSMPAYFFSNAVKTANARADNMANQVAQMGKEMAGIGVGSNSRMGAGSE